MFYFWNKKEGKWFKTENKEKFLNCLLKQNTMIGNNVEFKGDIHIASDVKIGNNTVIGHNSTIYWNAYIGDDVVIGDNTMFDYKSYIGDCCSIGDNSKIGGYTLIKSNVRIGQNVEIMGGITINSFAVIKDNIEIGEHTIIGRESLIDTDIESYMEVLPLQVVENPVKPLSKEFLFLRFGLLPDENNDYLLYTTSENFELNVNRFYNLKHIFYLVTDTYIQVTVNIKDITRADRWIEVTKYSNPVKINFNLNFKRR